MNERTKDMSEQQINDGYARLDAALAPPVDTVQRVGGRVMARRRGRRMRLAGGTAIAVLAAGGTVLAALSGEDGTGQSVAVDPPAPELVLSRPDGSTYAFRDIEVTCEAPPGGEPAADGPQRIWAVSPKVVEGDRVTEPFVYFEGIVAKIEGDLTFRFPQDWNMASDRYPMVLFAADSDGNEVASSAGGESGTVRVVEASCDPTPVLRLEVDMTLGSEVQQQPLRVAGRLR